jgi:hypothetical protein
MPRKFFKISFDDDDNSDHAMMSIGDLTYSLMRAGKGARIPPVGCASVMSDSGNRRKPIQMRHQPVGNLFRDIANGINIEPTAHEWIVIVLRDEDWQKLKKMRRLGLIPGYGDAP